MCARQPSLTKLLPLFSLIIYAIADAASFELNGKLVHSIKKEQTYECGDYRLKLISEDFPIEYETKIPDSFRIDGYYGPDVHQQREVRFSPGEILVPDINSIPKIKTKLLSGRTYLPSKARCNKSSFVIYYWSGGNCNGCETFVEFEVKEGKPTNPQLVGYQKVKNEY